RLMVAGRVGTFSAVGREDAGINRSLSWPPDFHRWAGHWSVTYRQGNVRHERVSCRVSGQRIARASQTKPKSGAQRRRHPFLTVSGAGVQVNSTRDTARFDDREELRPFPWRK